MSPRDFVLSWPHRALAVGLLATPAVAQPVEQRVAIEIGTCVIQRAGIASENERLQARVAELEKKLGEKKD